MLDLAFRPDRGAPEPLHRQLAAHLRELVRTGRLAAGEKLPATRELAAALAVGRRTVAHAYEALVDEGVLVAHVGQGTFVCGRERPTAVVAAAPSPRPFAWDALLSREGRNPPPHAPAFPPGRPATFDFRGGRVDASSLPRAALGRAASRAIREELAEAANDLDPLGYAPLRDALARMLVSRGVRCSADEILVTSGAQQGLDLVTRVLVDPGQAVAMEEPGYFGAALAFRRAGARVLGVPVDPEGLRTDALARALRSQRLQLVYVTPAAQMPTGAVLSEARRQTLLALADETQTPILEDDYDSEFRHGDPPLPALKTEDAAGQVIYLGTFSKALYPGLRVGYLVAAPALLARLAAARFQATLAPDLLSQMIVRDLLASGALERHVRRLRRRYAERLAALLAALERSLPEGFRWTRPRGGLAVWVTLPAGFDGAAFERASADRGIAYLPGRLCFLGGRGEDHLALSFASLPADRIEAGIAELGAIARAMAPRRRTA